MTVKPSDSVPESSPAAVALPSAANFGNSNPELIAGRVRQIALDMRFDLVGVAPIEESSHSDYLRSWIASGSFGQMNYLARTAEGRMNLRAVLPWAQSVICVAMSYYTPSHPVPCAEQPAVPSLNQPGAADVHPVPAKIARYAWGRDYHRVLYGRLRQFERLMRREINVSFESRIYVDTGPCSERELAVRAGLGWMGKNTLLIHPRHGSWFVLGELVTSLPLPPDQPQLDRCGTCTRCLDACPTAALTPYRLDAMRCISYQTLENRGEIPPELHEPIRQAGFIVGCDICQEVCPFNRRPLPSSQADFLPSAPAPAMDAKAALAWTPAEWDLATRGRAFRRAKPEMWHRNARIILNQ